MPQEAVAPVLGVRLVKCFPTDRTTSLSALKRGSCFGKGVLTELIVLPLHISVFNETNLHDRGETAVMKTQIHLTVSVCEDVSVSEVVDGKIPREDIFNKICKSEKINSNWK